MEWWMWAVIGVGVFLALYFLGMIPMPGENLSPEHLNAAFGRVIAHRMAEARQQYAEVVRRYEAGSISSKELEREADKIFTQAKAVHGSATKYGAKDYDSAVAALEELQVMADRVGNMMMRREHEEWYAREMHDQSSDSERPLYGHE